MNNFSVRVRALSLLHITASLLCAVGVASGAAFSVSPSITSNTYPGTITLAVSNVPAGDTVVIQKYLDANTNGVIDAGDWLAQQFNLTDDQAGMVIGGVTNFNVPGDLNSATGAITATLNFVNGDKMGNFVAKYLFKLSSPAGHFTPITNAFTVTNYPFTQKITGSVVSNGTNVPNAAIVLMSWPQRIGLLGTMANNSGSYTIAMPPGAYTLVAFKSNYVANMAASPVVNLGNGQTITTNVALTNATAGISGNVADLNNSGLTLPGVMVLGQTEAGFMTVATTDTNGNFTVPVRSGQWSVKPDDLSLIVHGYVGLEEGTNVNAGDTGVTLAVPQATALVYGSVKDNLGNPIAAIDVYGEDNDNYVYQTDGYSGTNGNYFVAVPAGNWYVRVGEDTNPTNYIYSRGLSLTLTNGQAVQWDFTALLATNHITGNVKVNGDNAANVWVQANANTSGTDFQTGVDTDDYGNYWLNVAGSNTWTVSVNTRGGDHSLPSGYLCGSQIVTISNDNPVVNFTALLATNHITGHVQKSNSDPIPGVGVWANGTNSSGNFSVFADTDGNGDYSLAVVNGGWVVGLLTCCNSDSLDSILGSGNYQNPDNQFTNIVGSVNPAINFTVQPVAPLQITTTVLPDGTVGDYYDLSLGASGGQPAYSWSLSPESPALPAWLTLDPSGDLHGTPDSPGTNTFSVRVTDSQLHTADTNLTLRIPNGTAPLQVTTLTLPKGTVTATYNTQLGATGGQPPYHWTLPLGSAPLPSGLSLADNGVISGSCNSTGTFPFIIYLADSVSAFTYQPLQITVNPRPVITAWGKPSPTQFQIRVSGAAGQNYTLQASTNLLNWNSVRTTNAPTDAFTFVFNSGTRPQSFYRVMVGP